MVLGVCCVFLGIFLNFSLQHFRFSVASLMPAAFRSGKKVKKRPSEGQKDPKTG